MPRRPLSLALLLAVSPAARAEIDGDFHGIYLRLFTIETLPFDATARTCGVIGTPVGAVRVLEPVVATDTLSIDGAVQLSRSALNVNHVEYWDWSSTRPPPDNVCLRITYSARVLAANATVSPSTPCPLGHTCWLVHGPVTEEIAPPLLNHNAARIFQGEGGNLYIALDQQAGKLVAMEWLGLGEQARDHRVLFRPWDCDDPSLNNRPCSTVGQSAVTVTPYPQDVPISGLVSYRREEFP